ncbi:MAG: hypothetical protein QOK22_565 [Gaiellaceae bacterium]|jgi:hypothetical protein|nr:hypothetical protein [Gaiellaceae bacterium]
MPMPDQLTEERRAQNEAVFRDANETLRAVQDDLGMPEGRMPFICECDDPDCRSIIRITQTAYENVRASPRRFVIAPGHTTLGDPVEHHVEYWVVEKSGLSGEIADETDPRRDA